jgi:hypothetical protein
MGGAGEGRGYGLLERLQRQVRASEEGKQRHGGVVMIQAGIEVLGRFNTTVDIVVCYGSY